jgi:hypothetical protein
MYDIDITFDVITIIQNFIHIHQSVQMLYSPQKFNVRHLGMVQATGLNVWHRYHVRRHHILQNFIHIHQSVQMLYPPQKFKRPPSWNGSSYGIKNVASRPPWRHYLPTKFHENPPIGSKILAGTDRQTCWWSYKPAFILWMNESRLMKPMFVRILLLCSPAFYMNSFSDW